MWPLVHSLSAFQTTAKLRRTIWFLTYSRICNELSFVTALFDLKDCLQIKYLGEDGENIPVAGAVAVCSPWDLLVGISIGKIKLGSTSSNDLKTVLVLEPMNEFIQ